MRIQSKITLLFFTIATAGLILINAVIFYFVSAFNFDDFFKRLEARVNLAAEINIHPDQNSASYREVRTRYLEKLEMEHEYIVKVESSGQFKKPLELPSIFYQDILQKGKARYNHDNDFSAGSLFKTDHGDYMVIITASNPSGFEELATLKKILLIVFFIAIFLTYLVGKIFSHYTIKPVKNVIRSVNKISADNLHTRLKELEGKDEISELVQTFNNMLNRLETAFATQNNFVSNASHELKTPMSVITSESELLLSQPDLSEQARASAKVILSHAEKLAAITTSLLGLAQTGFDGKRQNWQKIRVDELVLMVADSVKKIDPESNVQVNFDTLPEDDTCLYTDGNINLLQLALSNIVLNACKYSSNQLVEVRVASDKERISLIVTDKGIGIPQNEQQHIFEPFFRASNTTEFDGFGIGLPLTLNIIRIHKGSIGIISEEKIGTEMRIILPVSSEF
ncbi:ATP-binding protein [Pedobacter antarcticus]|uniref:HAMP domain-containing sensor histidine kinase n=1 Tax=Pedobacter antarcticus TaxID=34086 RepID=UPI001C580DF2|nr:HAMP domain-containing sensor histidine kinase [Pedobacter antarcticus]